MFHFNYVAAPGRVHKPARLQEANARRCVFGLAAVSSGTPATVKGVSADRSILEVMEPLCCSTAER